MKGRSTPLVREVLEANEAQVQKYFQGSEKIFGFLVGETMRRMKGKGNPRLINEILREGSGSKETVAMYELQRILVPTDFSRHAEEALEHALVFGIRYNASITLLHVDEYELLPLVSGRTGGDPGGLPRDGRRPFGVSASSGSWSGWPGHPVSVETMVKGGRAYKTIVEEAERGDYDLVIQAGRGQTHLSSYLIGSNAERVVRLSRQPVLTIRSAPQSGGAGAIRSLSDGSVSGRQCRPPVCALHRATEQRAPLCALRQRAGTPGTERGPAAPHA